MALERHQRRLLAGEENHSSFSVAENEMKRFSPTVLHNNCLRPVVIAHPLSCLRERDCSHGVLCRGLVNLVASPIIPTGS